MARPKPPTIAPEDLPKRPEDELEHFLLQLYFRLFNSNREAETKKLNNAWVAFEALGAVYPLLEDGIPHQKVCEAYPFPAWREETIEVPVAMLKPIAEGWLDYQTAKTKTLGQSFGFEHQNRQGKPSMKAVAKKLDKQLRLAAEVERRYRNIIGDTPRSLETAIGEVAQMFGVSESTVERAYNHYRAALDENLRRSVSR